MLKILFNTSFGFHMASTFPTFPSRSHSQSHTHTHTHPYRGRCMCVGVLLAEQYLLCTHNTHHHRECILTNCNNVCTQGRNTSSTNVLHTFKSFTRTLYVHTVQCTSVQYVLYVENILVQYMQIMSSCLQPRPSHFCL